MEIMLETTDLAETFRRPDGSEIQAVKGIGGFSIVDQLLQAMKLLGWSPRKRRLNVGEARTFRLFKSC